MFTGLIATTGRIVDLQPSAGGPRLTIDPGDWHHRTRPGESIAVNGCCLTHAPKPGDHPYHLCFDVMNQTIERTTLGGLRPGGHVNLEPSLTPDSPMDGHFVQGHIDRVAKVRDVRTEGEYRLIICMDDYIGRRVFPAGSVAVDGVSLTVAAVSHEHMTFDVALIATTLELTTLRSLRGGDAVNIETDMLVRAVVHAMSLAGSASPTSPSSRGGARVVIEPGRVPDPAPLPARPVVR